MNSHQLSKVTTAAYKSPVPGQNVGKTASNSTSEESRKFKENFRNYHQEDVIEVNQMEPSNFRPVNNLERSELQSFTFNRDSLSSQFLNKIQELKKEHQKTMTLLNQFYENEKSKSHSDASRKHINHLVPDYLDYTDNNTLYHGNVPDRGPDSVPGYTNRDRQNKFSQENFDSASNLSEEIELASNTDSVEAINRMWDEFSLEDYIDKGNRRPRKKKSKQLMRPQSAPAQKKEWAPVITIPEPFNMTVRDEQKKEKSHTRSSVEVSLRQKMRDEEEEQQRSKKILARDPPSHIYLPLYEEMCERREQRSRFNNETSVATTMALQKPFSFAERDERKLKLRKMKLKEKDENELNHIKKVCSFEAQPIPACVYDASANDLRIEDALYRRIKAKLRSEDTMRTSQYPPRMQSHEKIARKKKQVWADEIKEETSCSFKPQISSMPDFNVLHRHGAIDTMTRKAELETTVVRPFKFHSPARSSSRSATRDSFDLSYEKNRFTPRHEVGKIPAYSDTLPTRMSDSARLRLNNMRRSLQEADSVIKKDTEEEKERKERKRIFALKVQEKAAVNDPSGSLAISSDEKLRRNKKELRERQIRYNKYLKDVKRKVDQRPLLFEQHDEKLAKMQAERRYKEILESSGLSDKFIEGKSRASSEDFEALSPRDLNVTNQSRLVESDVEYSADVRLETEPEITMKKSLKLSDGGSKELLTSH